MAIEIEQRYKINSVAATKRQLAACGITQTSRRHIIDQWFIPAAVQSQEEQDHWFDVQHGIAYRIRRTERVDGSLAVVLDSKQHTEANNHNTFKEEVILEGSYKQALAWVAKKNYYNWLTLDKQRLMFTQPSPHLEVIIDSVAGIKHALGFDSALEIEYTGLSSRKLALRNIETFAALLGCKPDQLFSKSLTVAAMKVLARFKST